MFEDKGKLLEVRADNATPLWVLIACDEKKLSLSSDTGAAYDVLKQLEGCDVEFVRKPTEDGAPSRWLSTVCYFCRGREIHLPAGLPPSVAQRSGDHLFVFCAP